MRVKKKNRQTVREYPFFDIGSCNSDYGFAFEARFCQRCYRDMNKCNILAHAVAGMDWKHQLVIKDGEETCLSFKKKGEHIPVPRISKKQRKAMAEQTDIFSKKKE